MMKRYKLLLALALSLLVFWPLGAIKADTVNQPPESANQSEQASAAVVTNSSDSSAGARGTPSQDSQIAEKALSVSDVPSVAATETAASTKEGNTGNLVEDSAKPATAQPAEVLSAANQTQDQAASDAPSASKRVRELVEDMTLRQKITQMLMPDFRKWQQEGQAAQFDMTELNKEVAEAVDKYDFGGVILFAENVKGTAQTLAFTQALQQAAISNQANNGKLPLLLAIDQEGGIVYRLGSGTALPGNMAVGATRDPELANQAGQIIGRELSALGLNINFAPVFDTNNNPQNPVIGLRSFSSDPKVVARMGTAMMEGIQKYNVAVAAKHFPGHGDTAVDSHTGLPLVDKSYAELEALELLPFKAAIDKNADMLMTAHIQYPQIEKDTVISKQTGETIYIPATLSDDIITGIVRKKFGYKGVVVSDAMGMDAIAKNFGESEAAIMAIKSGVDVVLMPTVLRSKSDLAKIDKIINDIEQAVQRGDIPVSRLDESVTRILNLKEKRGILDFDPSERTQAKAEATVGSELNRDTERKIAASAVTVVKNEDTVLPFKVKSGDRILLLAAYDDEVPGLELGVKRLIADGVIPAGVTYEALNYSKTTKLEDLKGKIDQATHLVLISEIGRQSQLASDFWLTRVPTEVVDYANETGKQAAIMSISKPYDVANYPNVKAIVAVYGNKGMDPTESLKPENAFGPNIPAGVEVIFNGQNHVGKLPVNVPSIKDGIMSETEVAYPIGHGLFYTDPVKDIKVNVPTSAQLDQPFTATVTLSGLNGLEKNDYRLALKVDSQHFSILPSSGYTISGDTVLISKKANDTNLVEIDLKGLVEGQFSPVLSLTLIDSQGREFSMGEGYYKELVQITEARQSMVPGQQNPPQLSLRSVEPVSSRRQLSQQAAQFNQLPKTGDSSSLFLVLLSALFLFGAVYLYDLSSRRL